MKRALKFGFKLSLVAIPAYLAGMSRGVQVAYDRMAERERFMEKRRVATAAAAA